MTATWSPKRSSKRPAVCGVSAISGTSTIAERPRASGARGPARRQRLGARGWAPRREHHGGPHAGFGAGAGAGRQHELKPACGGGAVLVRDPEAEPHQLLGHLRIERAERLHEPLE